LYFSNIMKTPAKRNPLAWLAALLMLLAMWGCKTDKEELLSTRGDSPAVALRTDDAAAFANPQVRIFVNPAWDLIR
jgi:hypothetical protein